MPGTPTTFSNPKVHTVNLDLPPNQRWVEIAKEYKEKLIPLRDYLDKKQAEELGCCDPFAANVMAWATKSMFAPSEFVQELQGIASVTDDMDLTFNKLLSFNIGYNFLAHCTSISTSKNPVGEDANKEGPFHLRNMDWDEEVAAGFCDITIDVDFQRSGVSLFRITTWVGMIGCLTGMRYHTTEDP